MTLNEEIETIQEAEKRYMLEQWTAIQAVATGRHHPLREVAPEFRILHHPYTSALTEWGRIIAEEGLKGGKPYPDYVTQLAKLEKGVLFDNGLDRNWLGMVRKHLLANAEVSTVAWDARVMMQLDAIVKTACEALRLPDERPEVGMSHAEMKDILLYVQVYKVAREKGFDMAKRMLDATYPVVMHEGMFHGSD